MQHVNLILIYLLTSLLVMIKTEKGKLKVQKVTAEASIFCKVKTRT